MTRHPTAKSRSLLAKGNDAPKSPVASAQEITPSHPQPSKRTSSLLAGQDNASQPSLTPSMTPSTQTTVHHEREVGEPPKLGSWNPMSFDELYPSPQHGSAPLGSDGHSYSHWNPQAGQGI
ncbi:hypothetical protein CDD82_5304 [Ophiocordyceps australis]|uniref:Uncharacterized protein n=1 Tax=Ophiocordyceps australis TaxID=1399860 RepID=A0A2C5YVZ3_9HYPO|nr:hypothetical protein CDD82_5304 [Ophiocordyceps australis]